MHKLAGIPASNGIAIGPVFIYQPEAPVVEQRSIADPAAEVARLDTVIAAAATDLQALKAKTEAAVGAEEAQIFEVHRMFLEDPAFTGVIKEAIETSQINAEAAVSQTASALVEQFEALDDEYFRQRAADIKDIGQRLLRLLTGAGGSSLAGLARPAVILAHDLTPSDTATVDRHMVLAFCTAIGGATSHTAILSRSLGIPAVVGLGQEVLQLAVTDQLIVDGGAGEVWVNPDQDAINAYEQRRQEQLQGQAEVLSHAHEPATTSDGRPVEVVANIGSLADARQAIEMGAEGVGLLRTEFLFMQRDTLPGEEEQYQALRAIADVFQKRPLVVRTLDIGGDKPLPYLDMPEEQNPFLGRRAIRLTLAEPELFQVQLRASLRAGHERNIKIMFPMIGSVSELRRCRAHFEQARAALAAEKIPQAESPEVGIMVEIPSTAILADALAPLVDFFSIGTNDLAQYTLAADRTNPLVAPLADPLHPAVLRLIRQVIEAGHAHGKWVGMCGELAGNPLAVPVLVGLGLDEFSMTASAIPIAKALIRRLSIPQAQQIAVECLKLTDLEEVEQFLSKPF
ncbi:MAG: phosphoenolpyruvate--protein phosphotransferase [Anaerolineales bacterium]|nr:phosphoenolpyruvate--protein phosphotransferase [Anaerolineales bacterium]